MILHNFHIPVMGIGYSIDTPVKVAHYGISSVISLVDDVLFERMRKFYCSKLNIPFLAIGKGETDGRARRICAYLNLINRIVKQNFEALKASPFGKGSEINKYFDMLPDDSRLKRLYRLMTDNRDPGKVALIQRRLRNHLRAGMIDVNIMTKLDKTNYKSRKALPLEYNDAHAALRGFAESDLNSSIVLSAGLNQRLYSYMAKFDDFFPDKNGFLKKKIILKVSDYRSALTQGKFLARKGLWVSEYRIESGLNCGGHTFATQGHLLGPILEEFKNHRKELTATTYRQLTAALKNRNRPVGDSPLKLKITAQGGIGTLKEKNFLLNYYHIDSTGWGSPFLLVPEATNVDPTTLDLLCRAGEDDLYLSEISPLGVPFNSLRDNTKDIEKQQDIEKGNPGSACPRKFLTLNKEFTAKPICTASRLYQRLKMRELEKSTADAGERQSIFSKIFEKSCICVGLGTPALPVNGLDTKIEGTGVSVCPGPNMAYFTKVVSLKEMVDHIYGRIDILKKNSPNMFIKELDMYVDYLKQMVSESLKPLQEKQAGYLKSFKENLQEGIDYYKKIFAGVIEESRSAKEKLIAELEALEKKLSGIMLLSVCVS